MRILTVRDLVGLFNVSASDISDILHQIYYNRDRNKDISKQLVCFISSGTIVLIDKGSNLYKFAQISKLPLTKYIKITRYGLSYDKLFSKDLAELFDIPEEYIQKQLTSYGKKYIIRSSLSICDFIKFSGLELPNKCIGDYINIPKIIKSTEKHRNNLKSDELHYRFSKDFDKTRRFMSKQLVNQITQNQH